MCHVISRGDQRDDIFFDDADQYDFLKILAEVCQKQETTLSVKEVAKRLNLAKPKGARTNLQELPTRSSGGSRLKLVTFLFPRLQQTRIGAIN